MRRAGEKKRRRDGWGGWRGEVRDCGYRGTTSVTITACLCVPLSEWVRERESVRQCEWGCFRLQKWWNNISSLQHSWCCHADSHATWPLRHSLCHCLSQELTFTTIYRRTRPVLWGCFCSISILFRKSFKGP